VGVDCTEEGDGAGGVSYDGDLEGVGLRRIFVIFVSPGEPGLAGKRATGVLSPVLAVGVVGLTPARLGSG
jgi:hypothetical protein